MMKWQPIDTAPKDGSPILVFCLASREPMQEDPDEMHVAWFSSHGRWDVSGGYMSVDPTHWAPLPDRPEG